jgi:hypothetical protein
MNYSHRHRPLDSAFVDSITELRFTAAGQTLMQPDGHWDIAILKRGEGVQVLRTGLTTKPVLYQHEPGDETLVISFKPSVFMPLMPGEVMRDEGVLLEKFGRGSFWLGTDVREIPNLENADVFVERLVRAEVVEKNALVESVLDGQPKAMSERTMQRHFLRTTGLTYKAFTQIKRAQKAAALLRLGRPAAEVAFALGYTDQAHMINSLRHIMGQTPGQIAKVSAP